MTTRIRRACTSCRQVKLRCDSNQTFPSPCSRCKRGNLQCRIDPQFRRTRAKQQLEEVTNKLNAIQETLRTNPQEATHMSPGSWTSSTAGPESWHRPTSADLRTNSNKDASVSAHEDAFYYSSCEDLLDSHFSLGSAKLKGNDVNVLFKHFKTFYLRHCPIFRDEMSITELHHSSPFLFWTIVVIASRWHPSLAHLYPELEVPYQDLLARTLIAPILNLPPIQALVLLCIWPLAVSKQIEDPTWNYCGLLINAAMKLGIHKPSMATPGQEISTKLHARVRMKTWMACYFVNCSQSWQTGVRVPSNLNYTDSHWIPSLPRTRAENDFTTKVKIFRQYAKSSAIQSRLDNERDGTSVVQIMCKDLGTLRDDHREFWSLEAEILVLGSQLSLYAAQLESAAIYQPFPNESSRNQRDDSSRGILVNLAFTVAIRLIHNISELANTSPATHIMDEASTDSPCSSAAADTACTKSSDVSEIPLRYLPKHYMLMFALASILIFKVRATYPQVISYNDDLGQNHIRIAYDLLGRWSLRRDDEPSRIQRLIEVLSRADRQHILHMKDQRTGNEPRSGLAIMTDAVLTAKSLREKVGIIVSEDGTTTDLNATAQRPHEHHGDEPSSGLMGREQYLEDSLLSTNIPWDFDIPLALEQFDFDFMADPAVQDGEPNGRSTNMFGYYLQE